jgi:hypothetical protein
MDWLQFIVEMTKALAWPLAVILVIGLLRRPISGLISLIRKVRYGDFEINFEKEIRVAATLAKSLPATCTEQAVGSRTSNRAKLLQLAKLSPSAAISAAWIRVEQALAEAGRRHNLFRENQPATGNPVFIARALALRHGADWTAYEIFTHLRRLRNAAVHQSAGVQITEAEAIEFINLSEQLASLLERA